MGISHWIAVAVAVALSVLLVSVVHWLLTHQLAKVWRLAGPLVQRSRFSAYAAAAVIGVNVALPTKDEMENVSLFGPIQHIMLILMVAALTWLALTAAYAVTDTVLARLAHFNGDADRKARRLQTQVRLLRRVVASIIIFLAIASILFTFPAVQALGAGLLASAGLISIVAGVAAQSTLGNLFAGIQLAFNDTLRINDVVVYEDEWARVEQLSLTNVTLRTWDERRLVVPVSDFTIKAFENWTKEGTSITGSVMLRVDWEVPIHEIREETGAFVTSHPLWDGRRWALQATEVLESGLIELRAVVTAADSDARWDLCCDLREHLVGYLASTHPQAIPRNRTELTSGEQGPTARPLPNVRTSARPSGTNGISDSGDHADGADGDGGDGGGGDGN